MNKRDEQILRLLCEKGPLPMKDIQINISGTRGDIIESLYVLQRLTYIRVDSVDTLPRKWKATMIGHEVAGVKHGVHKEGSSKRSVAARSESRDRPSL